MAYQYLDDPIQYHEGAIRHHELEIAAMQAGSFRHYRNGRDDTAHMIVVAQRSKEEHERQLKLAKSYD